MLWLRNLSWLWQPPGLARPWLITVIVGAGPGSGRAGRTWSSVTSWTWLERPRSARVIVENEKECMKDSVVIMNLHWDDRKKMAYALATRQIWVRWRSAKAIKKEFVAIAVAPSGNWTQVSHVTGGYTDHYTNRAMVGHSRSSSSLMIALCDSFEVMYIYHSPKFRRAWCTVKSMVVLLVV